MTDEQVLRPGAGIEIAGVRIACYWSDPRNVVRVDGDPVALWAMVPIGDWIDLPTVPGVEICGRHMSPTDFAWFLRERTPTDIDPI